MENNKKLQSMMSGLSLAMAALLAPAPPRDTLVQFSIDEEPTGDSEGRGDTSCTRTA